MSDIKEETVTIPEDDNAVVVDLKGHSFVTILRDGREVVTDRGGADSHRFVLPPGNYVVRTDGNLSQAKSSRVERGPELSDLLRGATTVGTLRVAAAAPRAHPVDQVGQLPADGKSACTITIQQVDAEGKVMAGAKDVLYLRSTGGSLRSDAGAPISQVQLKSGQASFQLVAEAVPRFVTITVFGASPALRVELPFEFVSPSESIGRGTER